MDYCKKCVLPVNFPHIRLTKDGICQYCLEQPSKKADESRKKKELRTRFSASLKKTRGRGKYDVLLCLSGGKDSTYTLYLLCKKYRLNVLAYTFDNGFIPPQTYINIRKTTRALGVDHFFVKPGQEPLRKIFSTALKENFYSEKTIERSSIICASCIGMVKYSALRAAIDKKIPFVAFGWTPGQAPVEAAFLKLDPAMAGLMQEAVKEPLSRIAGKEALAGLFMDKSHLASGNFPYFVHPACFESAYSENKIYSTIKKIGWKKPIGLDPNSSNCLLNSVAVTRHTEQYGFNPYTFEVAKLVRLGFLSRKEGLKRLQKKVSPRLIRALAGRLEK